MKKIERILIAGSKKYYIRDLSQDYHTEFGFIKKEDLQKSDETVLSNTGKEFRIFKPNFLDSYMKIKRGAQIIALKDIGVIITEAGITKDSVILDAGSGSGAFACYIAAICKHVYTYEIRKDFYELVKKNIEYLGLQNMTQKNQDIYAGIDETDLDAVIFDLPEPWLAIGHAAKALKPGGILISYSPCIPQVADFVNALTKDFTHLKTLEVTAKEWEIKDRKVRPKTRQLGHTGFISFARKV